MIKYDNNNKKKMNEKYTDLTWIEDYVVLFTTITLLLKMKKCHLTTGP